MAQWVVTKSGKLVSHGQVRTRCCIALQRLCLWRNRNFGPLANEAFGVKKFVCNIWNRFLDGQLFSKVEERGFCYQACRAGAVRSSGQVP
jgi:hypothetical protein